MTRKPCEPTPIKATLILPLGGAWPAPPRTDRGTMVTVAAAASVVARNWRREIFDDTGAGEVLVVLIGEGLVQGCGGRDSLRSFRFLRFIHYNRLSPFYGHSA